MEFVISNSPDKTPIRTIFWANGRLISIFEKERDFWIPSFMDVLIFHPDRVLAFVTGESYSCEFLAKTRYGVFAKIHGVDYITLSPANKDLARDCAGNYVYGWVK